jgi:hypothetical protein
MDVSVMIAQGAKFAKCFSNLRKIACFLSVPAKRSFDHWIDKETSGSSSPVDQANEIPVSLNVKIRSDFSVGDETFIKAIGSVHGHFSSVDSEVDEVGVEPILMAAMSADEAPGSLPKVSQL